MLSLVQPATNGDGGLPIAQVRYGSAPPWPSPVAGSSLQLIDPRQDNWRPGNWTLVQTNKGASTLKWVFVTASIPATATPTLYLYLTEPGDLYLDDHQPLDARGVNAL